ncbi:hypothetical protein ACFPK1_21650 [Actinomycetospora rhizophila]|uniref:Uncharacterized protein n=1 Tax=Actinomycetospora rhizophila TaxID=1416876 RepID=A0ABV9ZJD3_9PSEU
MSEGAAAGSEGTTTSTDTDTDTDTDADADATIATAPRRSVLPAVVVALLAVDAVLLAWTEMAWLTLRTAADGFPLPLAAVVALVTTPVLVLAADAAWPASRAPLAPLAAWTLTVVGAGLWSPAGAGVLPPDWRAILLLAAGVLPGALALSWTSARRRVQARHAGSDG